MSYQVETMLNGVNLGKQLYNNIDSIHGVLAKVDDVAKIINQKVDESQIKRFITHGDVKIMVTADASNWIEVSHVHS